MKPNQNHIVIIFLLIFLHIQAQNDPFISHMGMHRYLINPAATGTELAHQLSFIYRAQWIGFQDAPRTAILNGHTYLPIFQVGLGGVIIQDKLGIENTTTFKTTYAYHIIFDETTILSMGLSAGVIRKSFDIQSLILENPENDIEQTLETKIKPDFGSGLELQVENFKAGFSINHLPNSNLRANNFKLPRHFYAYCQYRIPVSDEIYAVPGMVYLNTANIQNVIFSLRGEYENTLWFGMQYEFFHTLIISAGAYIQKNLKLGYSYDWNHSIIRRYNSGSHEVFLHYAIPRKNIKSKSPRFFN